MPRAAAAAGDRSGAETRCIAGRHLVSSFAPLGSLASPDSAGTTLSGKQPKTALPALRRHRGVPRAGSGAVARDTRLTPALRGGETAPPRPACARRSPAAAHPQTARVAVRLESFGLQGQQLSPARAHRRGLARTALQFGLVDSASLPSVVFGVFCLVFVFFKIGLGFFFVYFYFNST